MTDRQKDIYFYIWEDVINNRATATAVSWKPTFKNMIKSLN